MFHENLSLKKYFQEIVKTHPKRKKRKERKKEKKEKKEKKRKKRKREKEKKGKRGHKDKVEFLAPSRGPF